MTIQLSSVSLDALVAGWEALCGECGKEYEILWYEPQRGEVGSIRAQQIPPRQLPTMFC